MAISHSQDLWTAHLRNEIKRQMISSDSQTWGWLRDPWRACWKLDLWAPSQSPDSLGLGPQNGHVWHVHRWCWCCVWVWVAHFGNHCHRSHRSWLWEVLLGKRKELESRRQRTWIQVLAFPWLRHMLCGLGWAMWPFWAQCLHNLG